MDKNHQLWEAPPSASAFHWNLHFTAARSISQCLPHVEIKACHPTGPSGLGTFFEPTLPSSTKFDCCHFGQRWPNFRWWCHHFLRRQWPMESCTCHQAFPGIWLANHFGPIVIHTEHGPIPCQMQGDSLQWAHSIEQYFVPSAIQQKQWPSDCAVAIPMLQSKIAGKTGVSVQLSFAVKLPKAIVAHQRPWWLIKGHDGFFHPSINVCTCQCTTTEIHYVSFFRKCILVYHIFVPKSFLILWKT